MQILRVRNREKDIELVNQIYNAFHYFFFSFQTSQKHFVFIVYRNTHKGHGVLIFTLKMLMNILFMPH